MCRTSYMMPAEWKCQMDLFIQLFAVSSMIIICCILTCNRILYLPLVLSVHHHVHCNHTAQSETCWLCYDYPYEFLVSHIIHFHFLTLTPFAIHFDFDFSSLRHC